MRPRVAHRLLPAALKKMTPRPRETSDAEILAATARVMRRRSPTQLTLSDVAKEARVVPATLIQRFGTKRGLLLATVRTAPAGVPEQFAVARAKHASPLKALVELFVECTGFASTPESMANGLAYLQNDLTDPDFHAITLAQFVAIREETRKLLDQAIAAPPGSALTWKPCCGHTEDCLSGRLDSPVSRRSGRKPEYESLKVAHLGFCRWADTPGRGNGSSMVRMLELARRKT